MNLLEHPIFISLLVLTRAFEILVQYCDIRKVVEKFEERQRSPKKRFIFSKWTYIRGSSLNCSGKCWSQLLRRYQLLARTENMGYQKRRFTLPWDHSTLYKSLRLGWMALGDPRHFREEVGLYIELAESGSSCISGPLPLVIPIASRHMSYSFQPLLSIFLVLHLPESCSVLMQWLCFFQQHRKVLKVYSCLCALKR
jgi:hypothetical protein